LISSAKQGNESAKHELEEIASSIDLKPHKDKLAGIDRFMYDLRSTLVLGVIDRYWGGGVDAVEYSIKYFRHHRLLGFAIENYNKKNYEDAFLQLLKLSSDSDNVEAQGYLGLTYLFFKKDYVEAILLLKRAVNKGFDFAKPGLAEAYYKLGLSEESNQEAIELFKKSAEMGLDKAYYQLGNTYLSQGKYEDAIESFEIALRRGDVNAKAKLAKTYYLLGEYYLTSNSYEKAIKWYFLSENTGYKLSKKLLGRLKGIQRYGGEFSGSGSGFVVSKNGIIATNNHIVKGCKSIWVEGMKAVEIDRNNQVDLALIKVDKKFNNVSSISTRSIELGEDVTVFGFPFSSDLGSEYPTLTRGEVSSIPEVPEFKGSFRFSAPVNKGNSGGPIVNNNGLVIGVTLATFSKKEAQNVNIGIKAFNLISMLKNNNIKISNDSIKSIIEHYSDVTKYIECYE
jgi:TPR repeat protein